MGEPVGSEGGRGGEREGGKKSYHLNHSLLDMDELTLNDDIVAVVRADRGGCDVTLRNM